MNDLFDRIEEALGRRPVDARPLPGTTVAIREVTLPGGERLVAKWAPEPGAGHLDIERRMLEDLARESGLLLPQVRYGDGRLLVMSFIENDGGAPGPQAQEQAAEAIAALHAVPQPHFGYRYDTVIGRLHQPNPASDSWLAFFRDHRLLHMARAGHQEGTVTGALLGRIEALAGRLSQWLDEPTHPSLLHGDLWTGNVLCRGGGLAGFIDPAIYWGHPEIELAFATLFGTFGQPFFRAYRDGAVDRGFFEVRRDIYNIYPLLVHVRYWDTSYARPIDQTLRRLGL